MRTAKNLDQGNAPTCVRASLAAVITEQVAERTRIKSKGSNMVKLDQHGLYNALCNKGPVANRGCNPLDFNKDGANVLNIGDEDNNRHWLKFEVEAFDKTALFFDDYDSRPKTAAKEIEGSEAWRFLMGYKVDDVTGLHCIAVNEILGKRRIQGFNSWGKADPLPTMSLERPDLSIFKVAVTKCEMFGSPTSP